MNRRSPWRNPYKSKFDLGVLSKTELIQAIRQYNNVIKETKIVVQVVKG